MCTPGLDVCIVLWCTPDVGICIVVFRTLGVGVCVVCQVYVHAFVCHVWLCVCDAHYVYVQMVEEKELGVCLVWKSI